MLTAVLAVLFAATALSTTAFAGEQAKIYIKSLHKNGNGQKFWYEAKDGFMKLTGIPYDKLPCEECHAKSCRDCHVKSLKAADTKDIKICLRCHARHAASYGVDEAAGQLDFHRTMDMGCVDCHVAGGHDDVHGDGKTYEAMRAPGAVKTKCTDCHEVNQKVRAHKVHKGKLDCPACHISTSISCNNCHFDSFIKTKKKEGNFMMTKSWTMLVNYNGKVTAGSAQTLVYNNKKFVAYSPYFTHSVQAQAKKCEDCHANEAAKMILDGKKIPMNPMVNGKTNDWKGVIPCIPGSLEWTFYNKTGDKWTPITAAGAPAVQMVNYATPLTEKQLRLLRAPFKEK